MSTAKNFQNDGLTERANKRIKILLRCYATESGFDWVSQLHEVKLCYNCSTNETSKHSPFKVSYGFQPATPTDRLLPLTRALARVADRLTELASVEDVVRELLTLFKQRLLLVLPDPHLFFPWVILFPIF